MLVNVKQGLDLRVGGIVGWFALATVPCALFGIWNTGRVLRADTVSATASPTQAALLELAAGASSFLPVLVVALACSFLWALLFARVRRRPFDPAWVLTGWLFALLLPSTVPFIGVVLGVSFGAVFGQHVFGGGGKYPVSPALLGVLFLQFAYPGWFDTAGWQVEAADWSALFIGVERGAYGTTSEVLCLLGAGVLVLSGAASWRVMVGALVGAVALAWVIDPSLPWYGHLLLGQFAFCVAFVATDPNASAESRPARWLYGALIGALTVLLRVADPAHPEGTLLACLTAALFAPLIDAVVQRLQAFRHSDRALP